MNAPEKTILKGLLQKVVEIIQLEARMGSVDNKLNMILGALVTLTIACIADFIRRIRLEREPAGNEG